MSFLTKLPKERYSSDGFAGFVGQRQFNLGDGKAFAWMSQLAYETDEPEKIKDILHVWGMTPLGDGILAAEVNAALPLASTCAIVAVGRGTTIVAFAGTDPLVLEPRLEIYIEGMADTVELRMPHSSARSWRHSLPMLSSVITSLPALRTRISAQVSMTLPPVAFAPGNRSFSRAMKRSRISRSLGWPGSISIRSSIL